MVILLLIFLSCFHAQDIIHTQQGDLIGNVNKEFGWREFLGIPYALPPLGDLRWDSPKSMTSWSPQIYNATYYRSCCPQHPMGEDPHLPLNEDCLFLNVYTPIPKPTTLFPVMVWIHGGAYVGGCSSQKMFYSQYFANSTDTVVVTINYRLGALGFLSNPFSSFDGNYGIQDQMLALKWVQQNIQNFGGDPTKVTIFGESAGGMSVTIHLVSPQSFINKYFHRAIVQSNPATVQYRTKEEMVPHVDTFGFLTNCSIYDASCFRALDVSTIITAQYKTIDVTWSPSRLISELPWEPVIDPLILPDQPLKLYSQGKIYPVPTIYGNVRNESLLFAVKVLQGLKMSGVYDWEYIPIVELLFQGNVNSVLEHYPAEFNSTDALINLSNDGVFVCSTRNLALQHSKLTSEVYLYHFLWSSSDDVINADLIPCHQDGNVCHASELTFVFNSARFYGPYHTPQEQAFSMEILKTWASFAHGNIDNDKWPTFNNMTLISKEWDLPNSYVVSGYNKENCDFFDKIGYDF